MSFTKLLASLVDEMFGFCTETETESLGNLYVINSYGYFGEK